MRSKHVTVIPLTTINANHCSSKVLYGDSSIKIQGCENFL